MKLKKLISMSIAAAISASLFPAAVMAENEFLDAAESDWFYSDVKYVNEAGLMNGTAGDLFSPNETTKRGMIATILWRMDGRQVQSESVFSDVPDDAYYAEAITWAFKNGIVSGYSDTVFAPDDDITREQLVLMLYRYASYKGDTTSAEVTLDVYKDANEISDYAVDAFKWAIQNGIITGVSENTMAPNGNALRCQVAAILRRFCEGPEAAVAPETTVAPQSTRDASVNTGRGGGSSAGTSTVSSEDIIFNETFNQYISNSAVDALEITHAIRHRIVEDGANNKALMVDSTSAVIKKTFGKEITKDFVVSFDIKSDCDNVTFDAGVYLESGKTLCPVIIKDSAIIRKDGKKVASMSRSKYINIAYAFNRNYDICNVYINGDLKVSDIKVNGIDTVKGLAIQFKNVAQETYLDNVRAYWGSRPVKSIGNSAYNSESYDYIPINDWTGSHEAWNTDYMQHRENKYRNVSLVPKDNEIQTPRFEYDNKNRETWLKLIKTTSSDCYFDVNMKRPDTRLGPEDQTYKYYVLSGDFMTENGVQSAQFPLLRDSLSYSGENVDSAAVYIKGRNLVLCDGTTIFDVVKPGVWFNYLMAVDLLNQTFDIYIDGEIRAEDIPIVCLDNTKRLSYLSKMRIALSNGDFKADLKMDNCYIHGYEKPYVPGEEQKTSVFYDDTAVGEYLADKISFHAYAKNMMVGGVKYDISDSIRYDEANDEIYVRASVLNEKLSWGISDADEMIPVKKYAQENKGLYTLSNKNGLIVLSENEMNFDTSNEYQWFVQKPYTRNSIQHTTQIEALDDYVFFDRPKANEFEGMMNNTLGSLDVHPRVYINKDRFDELRSYYKTDATFRKWADKIISDADEYVKPETPFIDWSYQDQYRTLNTMAWPYFDRFFALGFAYQITGEEKYSERAFKEFEMLATFPDINLSHIIDTGTFNDAVAVGYDWMYDAYTPEQRGFIKDLIIEKCIRPVAEGFYGLDSAWSPATLGWFAFKTTQNYNSWVVGGLFNSTTAVFESDTEYLSDVLEKCSRSIEYTLKGFAPDGGWLESTDYWSHTVKYLISFAATAQTCFGTDFKVLDYQGISETPDWVTSLFGAQGVNNYGDTPQGHYSFPEYSFFAYHNGNKALASLRKYDIENRNDTLEIYDLIYFVPGVGDEEYNALPKAVATRGVETCGIRTDLVDEDAFFFSAHGGANTGYHMHYDTGAFIFDLNGVRWACDLGKENYNIGLSDDQIYRKRSEGHNTVTINTGDKTEPMLANGYAPIKDWEYNDRSAYITYDMSEVYAQTQKYTRGFYAGDDFRSLTIRDEITPAEKAEFVWTMNTMANVMINGNEAILSQDGQTLVMKVDCDAKDWEFKTMECQPLNPLSVGTVAQNPNEEYTKIAIVVKSGESFNITVRMASPEDKAGVAPVDTRPISQWTLLDGTPDPNAKGESITADFYADGDYVTGEETIVLKKDTMPEITVVPTGIGASYEIIKLAEDTEDTTIIKVYNADKSAYNYYLLKYSDVDLELWKKYNVLDVAEYSVSQQLQEENAASNMFDGDFETRWTSLNEGENVTVDLGKIQEISGVSMGFWKSDARQYHYKIEVSNDGINYTSVLAGTSPLSEEGFGIYTFTPVDARYVRIVGTGNTANVNTNILELRVLGNK